MRLLVVRHRHGRRCVGVVGDVLLHGVRRLSAHQAVSPNPLVRSSWFGQAYRLTLWVVGLAVEAGLIVWVLLGHWGGRYHSPWSSSIVLVCPRRRVVRLGHVFVTANMLLQPSPKPSLIACSLSSLSGGACLKCLGVGAPP